MRKPVPGPLFRWVKRFSWVELAIFSALIVFWLAPGFETETMVFGWAHGLGFVALCVVIWIAAVRREAPYTLLAATLTPGRPGRKRDRYRADRAQRLGCRRVSTRRREFTVDKLDCLDQRRLRRYS